MSHPPHLLDARLHRRQLLQAGVGAAALLALPRLAWADDPPPAGARTLVFVHLVGGNDGLNTVVPYHDPLYRRLRPSLALDTSALHRISDTHALHQGLAGLAEQWRKDNLAIVHGVGYPDPSYSHFRATEIWYTAEPERTPTVGWLGRALEARSSDRPLRAVALTKEPPLSLATSAPGVVNMTDFARFRLSDSAQDLGKLYQRYESLPGLRAELGRTTTQALEVAARIARLQPADGPFNGTLGTSLRMVVSLLEADLGLETIQVHFGGFDTHAGQLQSHQQLMNELGSNLNVLQNQLDSRGLADRVVTVVFSEFGRRAEENYSGGTDHGSAGPVFVLGRGVRPGFHGAHPSLEDLDDGNLKFTTDLRALYAGLLRDAFKLDPSPVVGDIAPLELFA